MHPVHRRYPKGSKPAEILTRLSTGAHVAHTDEKTREYDADLRSAAATTPIYPEPRPNDGHSSASDLATSASDGVPWVAAAASRGVAAALADGPEVSAALWGDRPEGDGPEVSAWALAVHRRQREEP